MILTKKIGKMKLVITLKNFKTTKHAQKTWNKKIAIFGTTAILFASAIITVKALDEPKKVIPEGYQTLYTSYEIKAGDTLWSLAEEHLEESGYDDIRAYIEEIKAINHIENGHDIKSGNYIILSYLEEVKQK